MFGRRRRSTDPLTCFLLETLPPLFTIGLIGSLSWACCTLVSSEWIPVVLFLQVEILGNWIQFIRNSSIVPTSRKNFPGYVHRYPPLTGEERKVDGDETKKWEECESCDMHVLPGSRHCSHCRKCVRLKDHHCYFLGGCVGSNNKRYFVAFTLHAAFGSLFGTLALLGEMSRNRNVFSTDGLSLLLPVNLALYLAGTSPIQDIFYSSLLNFGLGAFLFTTFMLFTCFYGIFTGRNFFRRNEKRANKILQADSLEEQGWNAVFGRCGWTVFLIPITPFTFPPVEPGYRRIITYNNDFVLNGVVTNCETPPYG